MKCADHPERDATGVCVSCGKAVCAYCQTMVDGKTHCPTCAENAAVAKPARTAAPAARLQAPGAVTSLVLAIVGFIFTPLSIILGPLAIYYSSQAKRAIEANPQLEGSGLATAGLVIGIIDCVFAAIGVLYLIIFFTCVATTATL